MAHSHAVHLALGALLLIPCTMCGTGTVYIAPINPIFYVAWKIILAFGLLSERTVKKFVLLQGDDWREQLEEALGPAAAASLPEHMRVK